MSQLTSEEREFVDSCRTVIVKGIWPSDLIKLVQLIDRLSARCEELEEAELRRENEIGKAKLSTALSLSAAYREALREITLYGNVVSPTGSMVRSIVTIARAALDRKPVEPAGREKNLEK